MKERKPEIEYDESKRKLLGMAFKTALGAGALGYLGLEALRAQEPKIPTPSGIFYPLYEEHKIGIRPEDLPQRPLDILWYELINRGKGIHNMTPQQLIRSPKLKPEISSILAQKGGELAFGDVDVKASFWPLSEHGKEEGEAYLKFMELLLGSAIVCLSYSAMPDKREREPSSITRRRFLKGMGVLGGWIFLEPLTEVIVGESMLISPENRNIRIAAIKRILQRINGLQSHFHPEFPMVFFRNAAWGHKKLSLGSKVKEELKRLPNIGYKCGGAHAGVEDFLLAGRGVSKAALLAYPKSWLRDTVEMNGGIENFCSTRLIRLPRDFTSEDIATDSSKWSLVEDRKIVDDELLTALKCRLG